MAGSRSPDGAGNTTISRETETQVLAACQPQPRQPHIIKLISQLQKPSEPLGVRPQNTEIPRNTPRDSRNRHTKRRPEAARFRIGAKSKVTIQTGAETESVAPPAGRRSASLQPPKSPLERPPGLKFGSPWTRQSASRIPTEPVWVPKQSTDRQQIT